MKFVAAFYTCKFTQTCLPLRMEDHTLCKRNKVNMKKGGTFQKFGFSAVIYD